jgi:hypothetical protein
VSEKLRQKGREFARFLQSLPEGERSRGSQIGLEQAKAEHEEFSRKFKEGICYLCHAPLSAFDKTLPCMHWLLKPKGFGKGDFPAITKKYGCFQLQSYLRWIANQGDYARNINDLLDEGTKGKLIELTIKYRHLEWAFSCSESDYIGHAMSQHAKHAHYHLQMRVYGQPFVKYNDFHVPFRGRDIINIEAMRAAPDLVKRRFFFGEGMNDVLRDDMADRIVNLTTPDGPSDEAPFKIDTIVMSEEGTSISGEDLHNLIEEARAQNVTIASLIHRLPNTRSQIIITPGPGVVEQAPRTGRKKGDDHK